MKRLLTYSTAVVLGAFIVAGASPRVSADENTLADPAHNSAQQREAYKNPNAIQLGRMDNKMQGETIRASKLIGMNIHSPQGKSLGEINDLVIDGNSGKLKYAAVTYGGFLGFGDKLFAVPYEAFVCRPDPDDQDEHVLVLNITQERLDGAEGFDQDNWPDFADQEFTSRVDKRYGVDRRMDGRRSGVNVDVNRNGVNVDVNKHNDNE